MRKMVVEEGVYHPPVKDRRVYGGMRRGEMKEYLIYVWF